MAATVDRLTLAEFERQYADRKPYHEYWFGKAIPKAIPTYLHGLLQKVLMILLDQAGYESASEVRLKMRSDFEPVPDVIASGVVPEMPYPTEAMEVVVEILSPEDSFSRVIRKCGLYADWGIATIAVMDPEGREGWLWERETQTLKPTNAITLPNGKTITLERVFAEMDSRLKR